MHIPRLICAKCRREMTVKEVGVVVEMISKAAGPYYKIQGDVIQCLQCGTEVVMTAPRELATHNSSPRYDSIEIDFKATFATE